MQAAQVEMGLLTMGSQQSDLRPRFLKYAADHFLKIAQGEKPQKPEPFMAEIVAQICAESVGADVPMPLQDVGAEKRRAAGTPMPTDKVQELPEARAWLESHGLKQTQPKTRIVVSLFLANPTTWWKVGDAAARLGRTKTGLSVLLQKLRDVGILMSEGDRSKCQWKLADMPPHV